MRSNRYLRPLRLTFATLGIATLVAAEPLPAAADTTSEALIGIIGITSSIWPTLIAQEKGYFEEFGLAADFVTTGSSANSLQQVAAGAVNIGSSSLMDTVRAVNAGAGLAVIANGLDVSMHSMVAAADIGTVEDLEGKRVIVGGVNDITNIWWRAMAVDHGLDPDQDVETLFAGSTSNRFAALVAGGVEAAVLAPPVSFRAVEEGYTDLGAVASYLTGVPYLVYHADQSWASENPDGVLAFVEAHNKAIEFLGDPANREEVATILAEAANIEMDIAYENLDLVLAIGAFAERSRIDPEGVARAIDILVEEGDITEAPPAVDDVYDARFVEQAAAD